MSKQTCPYCMEGELVAKFGIKICDLKVSSLYLFKEQSHLGRCVVAYKEHVSEIIDLTAEQRAAFLEDIATASNAIHKAFSPDKVNYGAFSDTLCHLHCHLVPKYKNQFEWGGTFAMNPDQTKLSDSEYEKLINQIKANLN